MPHTLHSELAAIVEDARQRWQFREAIAACATLVSAAPDDAALRERLETLVVEARLAQEIAAVAEPAGIRDPQPTVAFETKVWERDWRIILEGGRLETMIARCDYPFAERVVVINNVDDVSQVRRRAEDLIAQGVLTKYIVVDERADQALSRTGLTRSDLGIGYVYSIAEFVGICGCESEFLCHFSGDSILEANSNWISAGVAALRTDARFACVNPAWGSDQHEAVRQEGFATFGEFIVGFGFSDQCYLVQPARYRQAIYGFRHFASRRYPAYGGELFEKRVDSWMRCAGLLRLTHRHDAYRHQNFA